MNHHRILLEPTDVLFFRDGRPMSSAFSGHGAAWPLPSVVNHAFHAALHRAGDVFADAHSHRRGRGGVYSGQRDRRFGSLVTAGPFPVEIRDGHETWFFPRPADADDSGKAVLVPCAGEGASSLCSPCRYPVASLKSPTKNIPAPWWNEAAWNAYLGNSGSQGTPENCRRIADSDFSDTEHNYGIGIDPGTGSVEKGMFYSANYLRLRDNWRLGVLAAAPDKRFHHSEHGNDLVRALLDGRGTAIVAGGQQRICTAVLEPQETGRLPMPLGLTSGFSEFNGKVTVKWILLSPAVWPAIESGVSKRGTERRKHHGGWLPTWICPSSGNVLLESVSGKERKRRRRLNADGKGYDSQPDVPGKLVAGIIPKPLPVTGYALPSREAEREDGGAKPTHLAVPAGAVYYFECDTAGDAEKLAAALNWHGDTDGSEIRNRRSTLFGEKGYGLGVCGAWDFLSKGGAR